MAPGLRDPAGMLIVTVPLLRVAITDEYPPLVTVTDPVGVGVALTATVTVIAWVAVILVEDGVTTTVGVALVTVTVDEAPVALL